MPVKNFFLKIFKRRDVKMSLENCRNRMEFVWRFKNEAPGMVIGVLVQGGSLNIDVICWQARPVDYSREYLDNFKSISFHRHWLIDPYQVYRDWLTDDDNSSDNDRNWLTDADNTDNNDKRGDNSDNDDIRSYHRHNDL